MDDHFFFNTKPLDMTIKNCIAMSILVILLTACTKRGTDPKPETAVRLRSYTDSATGITRSFEYDLQQRITKERLSNSGRQNVYIYSGNKVLFVYYDASGTILDTTYFVLNAQGLSTQTYKSTNPSSITEYQYNAGQQVTRQFATLGGTVYETVYYYNPVSQLLDSTHSLIGGVLTSSQHFNYYPELAYTISSDQMGFAFLGKQPGKAPRSMQQKQYAAGGALNVSSANEYAYQVNASGQITKRSTRRTTTNHSTGTSSTVQSAESYSYY